MSVNGFVLIDKDSDWTSRDVCNKLGHILGSKKVGHIGTLDPFATGLLVVALGEGTKCLPYIHDDRKTYVATLKLGVKTASGDLTSEVVESQEIPVIKEDEVINVLSSFIGKQEQVPPMTSAVHYKGQKLYSLFRQGIKVDVPAKHIEIYDMKLISFNIDEIIFEATVSKGTYIRVLGEDIANRLRTVGHLISLRRTKINDICVENALKINDISQNSLIPLEDFMKHFVSIVYVNKMDENRATHGMDIIIKDQSDILLLIGEDKLPIAFYGKIEKDKYSCLRGFHFEDN